MRVIVKTLCLQKKRREWNDDGKHPHEAWERFDLNDSI
jgi:hypothetical protein